ncbi:hypothetical protein ES703_116961 [subsurface metagenome]
MEFQKEISLPFELIKLGYETSNWNVDWDERTKSYRQRKASLGHKRQEWIHFAAYCNDERAEQFVKELFLSEIPNKGDCLVVLWQKNKQEAIKWLEMIQSYDPFLKSLPILDTPYIKKLCSKFKCNTNELLHTILLKDEKAKAKLQDKVFLNLLKTEAKYRDEMKELSQSERIPLGNESREIFETRERFIKTGSISQDQADQLFEALWETNIELKDSSTELTDRNLTKVFVCHHVEDSGYNFTYTGEVNQILVLIPKLSSKHNDKIELLFNHLPFWQQKFSNIEEAMYSINPEKVQETWKEFLAKDSELGNPQRKPEWFWVNISAFGSTQPTSLELVTGLERIADRKDSEFLISLTNHYDEIVRKKVQEMLKDAVKES